MGRLVLALDVVRALLLPSGIPSHRLASGRTLLRGPPAQKRGATLNPEIAGAAMVELVRADAATVAADYLLTGAGLQDLR